MAFADPTRVESHIKDILNAAETWGGAVVSGIRNASAITQARVESGMEILRAVASNPQNSYFGSLMTLVTVAHNAFLPAHDGELGIPKIVPFSGGGAIDGVLAKPDQIDSWRADPSTSIYTGSVDGVKVAHDAADALGLASPVAGYYSISSGRFKFTGFSAQIPLIILTRSLADTSIPENYEPTLVKLSIPKLLKEGDNLARIVPLYEQSGQADLALIRGGSLQVPPVPSVELAQKAGVA